MQWHKLLTHIVVLSTVDGEDFSVTDPTQLNVFFEAGSMNGNTDCINIAILDDAALEGDHSFTVSLDTPAAPVTLTSPSSSPVTITDNDGNYCLTRCIFACCFLIKRN